MKYLYLKIMLTSILLIGCSSIKNKNYYLNTEQHTHIFKFTDCEDTIRHKHGGKKGEKIVPKNHKHYLSDGCQFWIDAKRKNKKIQGVNILALQKKLKEKGYYHGPMSGVINKETRESLKKYMSKKK